MAHVVRGIGAARRRAAASSRRAQRPGIGMRCTSLFPLAHSCECAWRAWVLLTPFSRYALARYTNANEGALIGRLQCLVVVLRTGRLRLLRVACCSGARRLWQSPPAASASSPTVSTPWLRHKPPNSVFEGRKVRRPDRRQPKSSVRRDAERAAVEAAETECMVSFRQGCSARCSARHGGGALPSAPPPPGARPSRSSA